MNSKHIVEALCKKHKKDFYLEQVKSGPTWGNQELFQLDMWVMKLQWKLHTIGYEIKVSRNDFVNDSKWPNYLKFCNQFSWVCPDGMISRDEIDPEVGLIYVKEDGTYRTVKRALFRNVQIPAELYRYIIMWRLYSRPIERRTRKEIIQDFLDDKMSNIELGNAFKGKLIKENAKLQLENTKLLHKVENWKELMDNYNPWTVQTKMERDDEYVNVEFLKTLRAMIDREISIKDK
jgi:hypothetical protein